MKITAMINNLTIRAKILVFNCLVLGITFLVMSYFIMASMRSNSEVASQQENLSSQELIQQLGDRFAAVQYWGLDLAISWLDESEEQLNANADEMRTLLEETSTRWPEISQTISNQLDQYIDVSIQAVDAYVDDDKVQGVSLINQSREIGVEMKSSIDNLLGQLRAEVSESNTRVSAANSNLIMAAVVALVLVLVVGIASSLTLASIITSAINYAVKLANKIATGDLSEEITVNRTDETGTLLSAMSSMQDDLKEAAAKRAENERISTENASVRRSLDVASAPIMMVDNDFQIGYANDSVLAMFRDAEENIQKALPEFSADKLVGSPLCVFDQFPVREGDIADELNEHQIAEIGAGGMTFRITSNAITDQNGTHLGTVVEWEDRTQKMSIEEEVQTIVQSALAGDLSRRIDIDNRGGFISRLSGGINDLVGICEGITLDMGNLMSALSRGDLSQRITTEYQGQFDQLKNDANNTIDKLSAVIERDINSIVSSASHGDLSRRIDLGDKQGFFATLSEGINQLVNICEEVITDTTDVLGKLSQGDLTRKIDHDYEGLFNQLKLDANLTIEKLTEVVSNIKKASDSVDAGAMELTQGNNDLSSRTEQQAASLEETASSMEEMTSTVKQADNNARKANELAHDARQTAEHGGEVVGKAVAAMSEINNASERIADIIGVIDELAFQTNLLALNASVEAARAGEQGRGFAVVASEVRNLAGRSATAAKEIKELIEDSVSKVNDGSKLVNETGQTLEKIVSSVQTVSQMVGDISMASAEQASGIEEVNRAINQMDEMTQQNAALVEEVTAASESMGHQASDLKEQMAFFNIGTGTH